MNLRQRINLFIFGSLGILTISLVAAGYFVINRMAEQDSMRAFSRELSNIEISIQESYRELESVGLLGIRSYVDAEKERLLRLLGTFRFGQTGQIYVLDQDRRIVFHKMWPKGTALEGRFVTTMLTNPKGSIWYEKAGEEWFAVFQHTPHWDWVLVLAITKKEMLAYQRTYLISALVIALALFLAVFLLSGILAKRYSNEIGKMLHCLGRVGAGDLKARVTDISRDELGVVQEGINAMVCSVAQKNRELEEARTLLEQRIQMRTAELATSEARYRALFESSRDAVMTLAPPSWRFTSGNPATMKMFGARDEDHLTLLAPWKLSPERQPDGAPSTEKIMEMIETAMREGSSFFEWTFRRTNGESFPATILLTQMELEGKPLLQATVRDITAEKRSELQYRRVIHTAIDGFWISDREGRLLDANDAYCQMTGYTRKELLGMRISDIEQTEDTAKSIAKISRHGFGRFETQHKRKDGVVIDVQVSARSFEESEVLFVFIQDITEHKRADAAFREQEQVVRDLLDSTAEAIYGLDMQGNFTFANPACVQLLGYRDIGELIGHNMHDLIHHKRPDGTPYPMDECPIFRAFLSGNGTHGDAEVLWRADGSCFPAEYWSYPIQRDGEVIGAVVTFLDITERKEAEAEQERLQRELQQAQKMEAVGQLTGGIAHDFNNILGIILGNNELALDYCAPGGQTKLVEHLKRIEKAGDRAKNLVAQMMAFSRNDTRIDKPLHLRSLVKEDIKMLRSTLPASIEINSEIEEDLPPVLMDPTQLNQILMNLCVNARDAMEGKGDLTIRPGWARELDAVCASCYKHLEGDWVELSVTDTGSGVPPDVLERIFDPFYTTKEVGKGTGMGLSVTHSIVHNHGGHVLVETEPGKGTTFRLLFPPVVEETAETQKAVLTSVDLPRGQGEHVLVVDDEPDLGEFIGDLLEHYGYRSKVLTSSKKALELFKGKPNEFALVVTDQTMPGITGKVLVKNLREISPTLPVILCTGFSDDIDAEDADRMGVHYLEKPVRAKSLIQAVGELLKPAEQGR